MNEDWFLFTLQSSFAAIRMALHHCGEPTPPIPLPSSCGHVSAVLCAVWDYVTVLTYGSVLPAYSLLHHHSTAACEEAYWLCSGCCLESPP